MPVFYLNRYLEKHDIIVHLIYCKKQENYLDIELPYFVCDEAFQLHKNVMRLYSDRYLSHDKSIFRIK